MGDADARHALVLGQPTFPVRGRFALRHRRVRLVWVSRLLLDSGAVAQRRPRQRCSRPSSGRWSGPGPRRRAPRRASLRLRRSCFGLGGRCTKSHCRSARSSPSMIRERLAGEHEEVLLVGLRVVHRHRLAGPKDEDADPTEGTRGPLEVAVRAAPFGLARAGLAAFRTYQPSSLGMRPCSLDSSRDSATIAGSLPHRDIRRKR